MGVKVSSEELGRLLCAEGRGEIITRALGGSVFAREEHMWAKMWIYTTLGLMI